MAASLKKDKLSTFFPFVAFAIAFVLILSAMSIYLLMNSNVQTRENKEKVLGESIQNNEKGFWIEYLDTNPYYYPGWKRLNEIGYETNDFKLQEETKHELKTLKPIEE